MSICPHCESEYSSKKERVKRDGNFLKFFCPVCRKMTKAVQVSSVKKAEKVVK